MSQTANALKQHFVHEYGGFADRRIKRLEKGNRFIVDDRGRSDVDAAGSLYLWFCTILAVVTSADSLEVELGGDVPRSPSVDQWISDGGHSWQAPPNARLTITLKLGQESVLEELAVRIESITAPGAPWYPVSSYKYVCPRSGKALRRLARVLRAFRSQTTTS